MRYAAAQWGQGADRKATRSDGERHLRTKISFEVGSKSVLARNKYFRLNCCYRVKLTENTRANSQSLLFFGQPS